MAAEAQELQVQATGEQARELFQIGVHYRDADETLSRLGWAPIRQAAQALRRAASNLIDNALRYAGAGMQVDLSLGAAHGAFAIEVRDRGPGIPPQDVERIKRPFARLDAPRSNTTGAGLGLAIVERIARSHTGRLELLPREGGGLVARLVLRPIDSRGTTAP